MKNAKFLDILILLSIKIACSTELSIKHFYIFSGPGKKIEVNTAINSVLKGWKTCRYNYSAYTKSVTQGTGIVLWIYLSIWCILW